MKAGKSSLLRPTIADVARAAEVSQMTVSRVINNRNNVAKETRRRVVRAISDLSYVPNPAARSLAAPRIRIGLLYDNPGAFFLSEFLVGAFGGASVSSVELVIERFEPSGGLPDALARLLARGVDGVVLPPPLCESEVVLESFARHGIPVIAVASGEATSGICSIGIDDVAAAQAMTRHLIALGHRRIGFITGASSLAASKKRLEGYRIALGEAGLEGDAALIAEGDFTYRTGLDAADRLLAQPERPTAIFASNDDMAAAVIAVAHGSGLDVPSDLSVCGFDDTGFATSLWPSLTTVRQPIGMMAHSALEMFNEYLRQEGDGLPSKHHLIAFEIIRRHSDAPPRRKRTSNRIKSRARSSSPASN